ncbi:hypothetical protein RND71_044067 [Anisodus tanguticus]|uniref:Kinesin-like protein n=1 Tax=Anisodus tanguticus TaxID=243964 RepID=A0AAE1QNQ2_9SOLA|nr:hypothetical protein RND71_044067 [Anisodus tanguticus]
MEAVQVAVSCLEGYNATIVAYGQTGSGKTYTMGTAFGIKDSEENGIIQRAVDHLFEGISKRQQAARNLNLPIPEFKVTAQFLELYNEDIIDLLSDDKTKNANIKIHEDENGSIYTMGTATITVKSPDTTLQCLQKGALSRQTGSTNMNAQSSRSHAIFTIFIKQQRVVQIENNHHMETEVEIKNQEFETLTAKFNFVDLAGSERLKRTGATGDRAKEGISINTGLLSLGNVISALGDKNKRALHVPYRDSKLTRLLQDSLGGNSRTLMIACISPSDRDFMETLGTLRYANRAKNIRNKVVANQDKSSQTISLLRKQIEQLELELQEYRQGKRIVNEDGTVQINDMYHENNLLQSEINNLKTRIKVLQETNERIVTKNTELLTEKELNNWIISGDSKEMADIVKNYISEIEDLRTKLIEMEQTCSVLRKQLQKQTNRLSMMSYSMTINENFEINGGNDLDDNNEILDIAKSQLEQLKKLSSAYKNKKNTDENENINSHENSNSSNSNEDDISDEQEENLNEIINCDTDDEDSESSPEQQLASLSNEISIKEKLITNQKEQEAKKLELKYKQAQNSSMIEHQFLTQMLDTTFLGDMDIGLPSNNDVRQIEYSNKVDYENNIMNGAISDSLNSKEPNKQLNDVNLFKVPIVPPSLPPKFSDYLDDDSKETNHLAKVEEHIARLEQQQLQQNQSQNFLNSYLNNQYYNYDYKDKKDDFLNKPMRNRLLSNEFSPSTNGDANSTLVNSTSIVNNNKEEPMTQSMISTTMNSKSTNGEIKRAPSAPSLK